MALILDDNADVWKKHQENLLQVYPYIFWEKELDNAEIRTVKHTEYYLHYLGVFLQRAITMYKRFKTNHPKETLKIQRIVRIMQTHLFADLNVHFTCYVAKGSPEDAVLSLKEAKLLRQRRAKITFDVNESNFVVANTFKATNKIKNAKTRGIPTVHHIWIKFSLINLLPMSTDFFDVTNLSEERFKDPKKFEAELFEAHSEQ